MRYAITAALLLSACATPPTPRIETVTVNVPVPVACVNPGQIPARPVRPPMPGDAIAALAVAMSWLADWDAYGATAGPIMDGCRRLR